MPKVLVFKGSQTSFTEIISGFFWPTFWPEKTTSRDGCVLLIEGFSEGALYGRLIYYHYWCWRAGGTVPVKISTGSNTFPRKYQKFPRNYYQYRCWIFVSFLPFSTVLVIFRAPIVRVSVGTTVLGIGTKNKERKTQKVDISSASYRIENPRNPENRRKIEKIQFLPIFLVFSYFGPIFSYFLDFWGSLFCSWSTRCQPEGFLEGAL